MKDNTSNSNRNQESRDYNNQSSNSRSPRNIESCYGITFDNVQRDIIYDVLDGSGRWCEGKVDKLNLNDRSVFISYIHWDAKFDEWVSSVETRLAPLNTHTYKENGVLKVGQRVEVCDERNIWLEAFIIEETSEQIKIHYKGYHTKFDEWITRINAKTRIRPFHRNDIYMQKLQKQHVNKVKQFQLPRFIQNKIINNSHSNNIIPGKKLHNNNIDMKISSISTRQGVDVNTLFPSQVHTPTTPVTPTTPATSTTPSSLMNTISNTDNNRKNENNQEEDERIRKITTLSQQYNHYIQGLHKNGFSIYTIEGDGNCLFRAVSHQIYGTEEYYEIVRTKCCDYMEIEHEFFSQFVEGGKEFFPLYLQAKRMNGCWGDDPEIEALCELYDRPAEIWAFDPIVGARKLRTFHETAALTGASTTAGHRNNPLSGTTTTGTPTHSQHPQQQQSQQGEEPQSAAAAAGVIRLSYYGGGHYDSVVAPLHGENITKLHPGEIENARIVRTMHSHTIRRHTEEQRLNTNNSTTTDTTIANLEREEIEKQNLDLAIQESRRSYLNTAYNDLETCLLQQYASNINNLSNNMTAIQYYKEQQNESDRKDHPDRKEDPEEGILNIIQKQSENEYYEKEIIASLKNDTAAVRTTNKEEDNDLLDAELIAHIREESEKEAKRKENELIEAALLESTQLKDSSSGSSSSSCRKDVQNNEFSNIAAATTTTTNNNNNNNTTSKTNSNSNNITKVSEETQVGDNHHIIHLADLKENEALELALKQSLEGYTETSNHSTKGSLYPLETSNNYSNEDELLQFALEASLQGYTSSNYADYIDTYQGHASSNTTNMTTSGSIHHNVVNHNNPDNRNSMMYYTQEEEGEEMDPDLMLAIAESLRK